jgi:ATP-binding cassette subfamily B protein
MLDFEGFVKGEFSSEILVVKDGEIVERRSHSNLLGQGGFYHDLYLGQFKGQMV